MHLMTRKDFIIYLSHPESLNGHSIGALEKLVQDYPYCQTARLLFLKNLHNENSIAYEKNLHITSAYAPGGKVLYNLIKKKAKVPGPLSREETVNSGQYTTDNKQPIEEPVIERTGQPGSEVQPKEEIPVPVQAEIELPAAPEKKDEYDELQLLEKEMLREAYRTSMTVDLLGAPDELKSGQPGTFRQPAAGGKQQSAYSFTDWLKVIEGKNPGGALEERAIQKQQKTELIDKFILEETAKITPKPKAEFYSAESMAKKSIQDDETFVSETLAGIYLRQGNLQKALRAYEILVVKHPEKIHIFAPLLEKLKKLLQEQKNR